MSVTVVPRPRRPQLTDTIDRLDQMVDGLAEAIPGAVADSVREVLAAALPAAVQAAVDQAVAQLAARTAKTPPGSPAAPANRESNAGSVAWTRVKSLLAAVRGWAGRQATGVRARVGRAWSGLRLVSQTLVGVAKASPKTTAVAVTVGLVIGVGSYQFGPMFAAILAGLGAGVLTLLGVWLAPFARFLLPPPVNHDGPCL